MNPRLSALIDELYAGGVAHDAAEPDRLRKRRNLEPATAALLGLIVRIAGARQVVEIGTGNGFSTLWLADAVGDTDGRVVSVDTAARDEARTNLARADAAQPGLAGRVELRQEDGGGYLARLADESVYPLWWPHPSRVLRPGGLLAVDNVLSHAGEAARFLELVSGEPAFVTATIDVGKGLHLAWRRGGGHRET